MNIINQTSYSNFTYYSTEIQPYASLETDIALEGSPVTGSSPSEHPQFSSPDLQSHHHCHHQCPPGLTTLLTKYAINSSLILIILASILGNLLVCIAIYTDRRLRKLSNLFLVSLALADLFVGSIVMTLELTNNFMGHWVFGQTACETWISFDIMCCTASILNLCAISLDRFLHIKDPLRYNQWMTKRVVLAAVGLIWFLSGLISFVPVSLGWHKPSTTDFDQLTDNITSPSSTATSTASASLALFPVNLSTYSLSSNLSSIEEYQCALDLTPLYAVISSTISFYLPCLIMIGLYTRLYLYARKHVEQIRSMAKPLHFDRSERSSGSSSARSSSHHSHHSVMDHKAAITLGVIMGVFLICWVPFFCANIIAAFCKTCISELVFKSLTWLGWFNSALNPIIYSIFNTEFREAFRKILLLTLRDNEWCRSLVKEDSWFGNGRSDRASSKNGVNSRRGTKNQPDRPDIPPGAHGVKLMPGVVQGSSKYGTLIKCKTVGTPTGHKGYTDIIPIKDNIEIICDGSTGKISAI